MRIKGDVINEVVRSVTLDLKNGLATVDWYETDEDARARALRGYLVLRHRDGSQTELGEAVIEHPVHAGRNDVASFAITYKARHLVLQPLTSHLEDPGQLVKNVND